MVRPLIQGSTSPLKNGCPACSQRQWSLTSATARRTRSHHGSTPRSRSSTRLYAVAVQGWDASSDGDSVVSLSFWWAGSPRADSPLRAGKSAPPSHWPSSPCKASSPAPQPSMATRARSAATTSVGASTRSRNACQRMEGSESSIQSSTATGLSLATVCSAMAGIRRARRHQSLHLSSHGCAGSATTRSRVRVPYVGSLLVRTRWTTVVTAGDFHMDLRQALFQTDRVLLNYAEGPPNGPAFVLLHGGAARWQYGEALLEILVNGWHVYAPDFRGHGHSGRVPGAYSLREYERDTTAFLEGVVREPAIVYGHSLGGEVAVMLAAEHPELIAALIVGDAPLSIKHHLTEEPAEHRAQNLLWPTLCGRPVDEIEAAIRSMPIYVPSENVARPASEVLGNESPFFRHQAVSLHLLDPDMLAAVNAGPLPMLDGYEPEN